MARSVAFPILAASCVVAVMSAQPGRQAQNPSTAPMPRFGVSTDVLQLDVTVLDKDGYPVAGLTPADFTVTADDAPLPVVAANWIELPPMAQPGNAWPAQVASDVVSNNDIVRRIVVFVVDDANTGSSEVGRDPWILRTGKDIVRTVIGGLGPNDLSALVFTYRGRNQELTSDHEKLLRAIDTYVPQATQATPLSGTGRVAQFRGAPSHAGVDGVDAPLGCSYKGANGCTLDTLEHVIDAMPMTPPMRKIIVFISQGYGAIPGFNLEAMSKDEVEASNRDVAAPDTKAATQLLRRLQQTNTTIYAYSPGSLLNGDQRALQVLAESTGGRAYADNAPSLGVPQMFSETRGYYIVGVENGNEDGRFHRLSVRVNRPGLEVRSRIGYVAPGAADATAKAVSPAPAVDQALARGFPKSDLPLMSAVAAFAGPTGRDAVVHVVTGIPSAAEPPSAWPLSLVSAAFDTEWKQRAAFRQTVEVQPAAGSIAEARSMLVLNAPGRYAVRTAGDGHGRTGTVLQDIDIADYSRKLLSASDMVIVTNEPALASSRTLDVQRLMPTIRRTFSANDRPRAVLQVYQSAKQPGLPVTLRTTISDARGQVVVGQDDLVPASGLAQTRSSLRTADVIYPIPVSQLATGEYLLTVSASADSQRTESRLRFRRR